MTTELKISREDFIRRGVKIMLGVPMFGAKCEGIFCRSAMDLAVVTSKFGVPLQLYFLFNESLITRARNYIADEFMRSDCTHLMFIDSDIGFNSQDVLALAALAADESPYDVISGVYPKKSLPYTAKVLTEDGYKEIGWIVDNRYSGKVLSQNAQGEFVWNRIIQHHHNRNDNKWVELKLDNRRLYKRLKLTYDHEMASVSDPLSPVVSYVNAGDMVGRYAVRVPARNHNALYNSEQVSVLIGTLLGDAHSSKRDSRVTMSHGEAQKEYIEFKQNILGGKITQHTNQGFGNGISYHLDTPINAQTRVLREKLYHSGDKSPKEVLSHLNPMALAFWYMDDGCMKKSGNTAFYCELNTQGFSDQDQELLVDFFKQTFGFDVRIDTMKPASHESTDLSFKRLRFLNKDADAFFAVIAPFIPACMEYKLPPMYRGGEKHDYNTKRLDYALLPVLDVRRIELDSDQYDIGVENNHNFVTDNILVSNCISWEKIKTAVDKGFADEDPNNLANFVGDFVFNPLPGVAQIPINQPVEVLETGTGFMMIRRSAFEKVKANRPDLSYRPDHVRTDAFDGTREIMAYFMDPIDRTNFEGIYREALEEIVNGDPDDRSYDREIAAAALKTPETLSKRLLSEDYFFSQEVRKAGGKVWICPWIKLEHVGAYTFGGSLANLAQAGVAATADPEALKRKK
jgi:hypothetical protein